MLERELRELLAELDVDVAAVEPEAVFADWLFGELQVEAARSRRWPRTSTLLVAALLVAALAGAIAVGAMLLADDDPADLVRRSQAVYSDPPPFTMVTTSGEVPADIPGWYTACADPSQPEWRDLLWQYDYDGAGAFRQACLYGGPASRYVGGFEVQTPAGHGTWDAAQWSILPPGFLNRPTGAPLVTPLWLNWLESSGQSIACDSWHMGGVDPIAGRPAREVACGTDRYWIDEQSSLLVKREIGGAIIAQATRLEVGTPPTASLFELHEAGFSIRLNIGRAPIEVTLPHIEGGEWRSASLQGQPAALLVQSDCHEPVPCLSLADFVDVVSARSDRLNAAAVSHSHAGAYAEAEVDAALQAGVAVLVDKQSGWPRWEYPGLGVLLFEADGRYAGLVETRTRESLTAAIDALLAGTAIPSPPPGDGMFVEGEPAPPLAGSLLGGEAFDLDAFRGSPAVVIVPPWLNPRADAPESARDGIGDALRLLTGARAAISDSAQFGVIAWSSPMGDQPQFAGWDALLGETGVTPIEVSVIGPEPTQESLWTWLRGPVGYEGGTTTVMVVLDAEGRVRHVIGGALPSADVLVEMLKEP